MLSIIGLGGIVVMDVEQQLANNIVAKAVDRGINYFDVAPTYGNAEEKLGPALKPYRQNAFLACKTTERDKDGAERELNESLRHLQTDHFDLYQLHALTTHEDVEKVFGPDGAMEVFLKAKQEGKVRFLGFSAHSEEAALLAIEKFDFDTVLFPINFVCWFEGNFGQKVVAKARQKQMGILALKALAFTRIPEGEKKHYEKLWYVPVENDEVANLAVRFTLSQATTAAIPPGEEIFFWKAVAIVQNFTPLTEAENQKLKQFAKGVEPLFSSN
jgi:predicted aldo/keto reductase-like oxidoreductase